MAKKDSTTYGVIYCITNKVNGKKYIGQTVQSIKQRWAGHQVCGYCAAVHLAIKKYGPENFHIEQIAVAASKDELDDLEQSFIEKFGTLNRKIGYNLRGGGSFGKHSDESRRKMSEKVKFAYANSDLKEKRRQQKLGSTLTELQKCALRDANLGKKASPETKRKLSEAIKSLWAGDAGEKMRQASIAARKSETYKTKVACKTRQQWGDPEMRAKLLAAQSAGKAAFWADPEKRAARIAKRRATMEAKKASQI